MKKYSAKNFIILLIGVVCCWLFVVGWGEALAANVSFTADTILDLTGLSATFYAKSGSACDSLTVSGADLTADIPAGSAFVIKSSSDLLSITPSGGNAVLIFNSAYETSGLITQWTLNSSTTNTTVSQQIKVASANTSYRILSDGSLYTCFVSDASANLTFIYSGGFSTNHTFTYELGSCGGGGGVPPIPVTPTPTPTPTPIPTEEVKPISKVPEPAALIKQITKYLIKGMKDEQIKYLQEFLAQDKEIYPEGLITGYFGNLTEKAVQRFQKKYGIVKEGDEGFGTVGLKTRAKLNELLAKIEKFTPSKVEGPAAPVLPEQAAERAKLIQEIKEQIKILQEKMVQLMAQLVEKLREELPINID